MLEEPRMDKKSINRSVLQQSRPSAIDCKKSTELTHKPWPRNNKKREGSGSVPKNEPSRKNIPSQRGRGQMDKRPRARGATNFSMGGAQNTGLEEDEEPEIGSVFVPGSKKQNLNHLLNFMYPSRGSRDSGRVPVLRRQVQRFPYRHEHDLYLRAYCQFVVREHGDFKLNMMDPDLPLKWESIEEIVVRSTGKSECPICLGTPVAARVGHCGHVYCWACILHYAAAHDKQPPPCPVCATNLQVADMKPTRTVQWESPPDEVTMRLVRRLRGSTVVEVAPPRGQYKDSDEEYNLIPMENISKAPYAKYFFATKQQIMEILERDRQQIQDQIFAEIDTTEIVYLEQALEMLKLKEEKIKMQYDQPKNDEKTTEREVPVVFEKQELNEKKLDWFDVTEEGATCLEVVNKIESQGATCLEAVEKLESLNIQSDLNPCAESFDFDVNDNPVEEFPLIEIPSPDTESLNKSFVTDIDKNNQSKYFYFYQADDGQQVFLNSLNVRILNSSWGVLAAAPSIIKGRILQRETYSLNDQTRKHMPYTAHLPLHCSFDIVELDLKPPYVTNEALGNFTVELERRARIRAKHDRDERRRERAYRRLTEGPPKPDFSSEVLFPSALPAYSPPQCYGSPPYREVSMPKIESPSTSGSTSQLENSPSTSSTYAGPSFAKMASTSGTWRVRKTVAAPPPPPANEDEASGPRALVLSDAIEAALLATSPTQTSGKKNKKSKQKVLFATGMHRAP